MWERTCTAFMVVVAAVAISLSMHHHYSLPAQMRKLKSETRHIQNGWSDLAAKPLPYLDAETSATQRLAQIDYEVARAEADSLLLQSKLLEILASMSHEEQAMVPTNIKDMLARVDVLSKDTALALIAILQQTHWVPTKNDSAPSPEATATAAKDRMRSDAVQQLDELVAEVVHWRNTPSKPDGDDGKSKGTSAEGRALATLRNELLAERKWLAEISKSTHTATLDKLRKSVETLIPKTDILKEGDVTDFSGKHSLIVAANPTIHSSKFSEFLSAERYGTADVIESGVCNQDFGTCFILFFLPTFLSVCLHLHQYLSMYIYAHTCMYICIFVYIVYTYRCIYMHKYA